MNYDSQEMRKAAKQRGLKALTENLLLTIMTSLMILLPRTIISINLMPFYDADNIDFMQLALAVGVALILDILVLSPLVLGGYRTFYLILSGKKTDFFEAFSYISDIKKYFYSVKLSIAIKLRLAGLFILIIAIIYAFTLAIGIFGGVVAMVLASIYPVIVLIMTIILMVYEQLFNVAIIYATQDEELSVREAVKKEKALMRGKFSHMASFYLSFLGWMILSVATGGILAIFLYGYYGLSYITFVEFIKIQAAIESGEIKIQVIGEKPPEELMENDAEKPSDEEKTENNELNAEDTSKSEDFTDKNE